MIEGVDYAFSRPSTEALVRAGKRFACRYGGAGTTDKWLTATEADDLSNAGIGIVANVEGATSGLLGGYVVGARWAAQAHEHFRKCGMPTDRPIYLSVDFDVQSGQWPAVADALRGAASVIGVHRVGIYGGRNAIRWARRDGVATWFWQTYAWSGSPTQWVPGNHIEQYRNGVLIGGADCDLDRVLVADCGQWYTTPPEAHMTAKDTENDTHLWHLCNRVDAMRKLTETSALGEDMPIVRLLNSLPTKDDPVKLDFTPETIAALAVALEPALERALSSVLSRLSITVDPGR